MEYRIKTNDITLTAEQLEEARKLGISDLFFKLLLSRGMSARDMAKYLHPSLADLSSPMSISGMDRAAMRLKRAIENKEKILIYGDYDCDGICAVSILMLCLGGRADVSYFIPDRNKDGYGISEAALARILASKRPNLVITVDCGVTAVNEVKYLTDRGIDVIVTDHHEPQDILPDCIVVDAKIDRNGFSELCGAGVALKLAAATVGEEEAYKHLDIAAIATIADVVPLTDDNRIIAYYGIRQLRNSPSKGVKMLMGDEAITSHSVMFKLAPRMNAAGRLGSAMKVVGLFLEKDYFLLKTLAEELIRDNTRRQEMCGSVVDDAKAKLKGRDFNELGAIVLYDEKWEPGVLGIAAAKLVEEFKRPAILFGKNGEELKGSARSIPTVNIFELLSGLTQYFTSFGGHAQAAGVSLKRENFEAFALAANKKVLEEHSAEEFDPPVECEMALPRNINMLKFAQELELMEPTGYANPRPTFLMEEEDLNFERIGFSKHVKCQEKGFELVGFTRFADVLACRSQRARFEVTLSTNTFQNNIAAQALIRSVNTVQAKFTNSECLIYDLHQLGYEGEREVGKITALELRNLLNGRFGTLICCFNCEDYDKLGSQVDLPKFFVATQFALNPVNAVVLCPAEGFDFGYYRNVVIAGDPLSEGYVAHIANSVENCYMLEGRGVRRISVRDDVLRSIYKEFAGFAARRERFFNMRRLYVSLCSRLKVPEDTFNVAVRIFTELGLLEISDRGLLEVPNRPVRLNDSVTYRNLSKQS